MALRIVASSPGQKLPKYAAITTAGKNVMCGTASCITGQSGHRIKRHTAVASTARPYANSRARRVSRMPTSANEIRGTKAGDGSATITPRLGRQLHPGGAASRKGHDRLGT